MKLKKLFDNKEILVIDKQAGVTVFGSDFKFTKKEEVQKKSQSLDEYLESKHQGYLATHRLDKDTTGCLIIAKNEKAFENIKKQFQNHTIKKEYLAIVWGHPKHDTGIIDVSIARSKTDFRKKEAVKVVSPEKEKFRGEERAALTRYKVLKRVAIFGQKVALVAYYPETGRTHQIRIHTKTIGHPIVGDHLYGVWGAVQKAFEKKFFKKSQDVRTLLHAKSIAFQNPENGEVIKAEAEVPPDFRLSLFK